MTHRGREASSSDVEVRGAVAVALSRFPTVTETFILREVGEMERQVQPVRLVPLLRDDPPVVHAAAGPWMDRALFTRFVSVPILRSNLRAFARHPSRYVSVLGTLVRRMAPSPAFLMRTLALFPKAVHLAERLEEEGIRHVHAHFATHPTTAAWVMASLSDLTYSVTAHAHDIFVDQTFLRQKLEGASFVRVISEYNRRYLLSRFPELDPDRIHVVHVGIDARGLAEAVADARAEAGAGDTQPGDVSGDLPLVVSVASLRPYKGIPVLLDACRSLKEAGVSFRCAVAGDGPMRGELEARVAEHGLEGRVRFLGAVPEDEIPALLARADVFVLPSVIQSDGQMEGIPVALMEAMAAGLPVVTSELSGIPELVEDGVSGVLVRPGSADGVAAAVRELLERPDRARPMGERGRAKVREEFDLAVCAGRLLELLGDHGAAVRPEVGDRLRSTPVLSGRASSIGVRRTWEGRDSWVAEVVLGVNGGGSWPREAVMKVHRSRPGASRPANDRARTEFEALLELGGLGAPRPLHLDEPSAWLLMTRCDGESLLDRVRACRAEWTGGSVAETSALLHAAGRWLRSFQERTARGGSAEHALDRAADDTVEVLEDLRGTVMDREETTSLIDRLARLRAEADPGDIRVLRHGDFWPGNLIVDRAGRLSVIDFEGVEEGHPLEDPAYFLVQLGLYFAYPGLGGRGGALERAFLEGWGADGAERSAAFRLLHAAAAARTLRQDLGGRRPTGPSPGLLRPARRLRRRFLLTALRGGP